MPAAGATRTVSRRLGSLCFAVFAGTACILAAARDGSDSLAPLQASIGSAPCQSDEQCQTLPVGAKACGGPGAYLAFSTANTDADELKRLSAEHAAASTRLGIDRFSTCSITLDPGARCVFEAPPSAAAGAATAPLGSCRLRPASPGAPVR